MIDKTNLDKTNAWPFVEIQKSFYAKDRDGKILKVRVKSFSKLDMVLVVLPHIGTFGEVARTSMID